MKIVCRKFQPFQKNTLRGFAEVVITDIGMVVRDVTVHTKNDFTWASPPAKPQVKDGRVVTDNGRAQYVPIIEFCSREARDDFSLSVVEAVLKTDEGKRALSELADDAA
jgi:hypothetical protein